MEPPDQSTFNTELEQIVKAEHVKIEKQQLEDRHEREEPEKSDPAPPSLHPRKYWDPVWRVFRADKRGYDQSHDVPWNQPDEKITFLSPRSGSRGG